MLLSQPSGDLVDAGEAANRIDLGLERAEPELVDRPLVHARGEIVADLSRDRVARFGRVCRILQDAPEVATVVVPELRVDAPAGLIGGNRVVLPPAAARVLVEVGAGIRRAIHGRDIQAWRVWKLLQGSLGSCGRGWRLSGRDACQCDKDEDTDTRYHRSSIRAYGVVNGVSDGCASIQ